MIEIFFFILKNIYEMLSYSFFCVESKFNQQLVLCYRTTLFWKNKINEKINRT